MKQLYFINEKEAVKFLVDFVLPFLDVDFIAKKRFINNYASDGERTKGILKLKEYTSASFVDFLVKHNKSIEFLELINFIKTERIKTFRKLRNGCLDFCRNLSGNRNVNIILDIDIDSIDEDLADLYDYLYGLICLSFSKTIHSKLPIHTNFNDEDKYYFNIQDEANQLLNYYKFDYLFDWSGMGNCSLFFAPVFDSEEKEIFDFVKVVSTYAIAQCLYSKFNYELLHNNFDDNEIINKIISCKNLREIEDSFNISLDEYMILGEGFSNIGLCSVCGRVFYKNRKDKEFCCKECSSIGGLRRFRQAKKENIKRKNK